MTPRLVLLLALCAAIPAWSQATGTDNPGTSTGSSTGGDEQPNSPLTNDGMLTPPPVSGQTYPILTGSEERRNFMTLGATANVAYDDNVEGGYTGVSKGDMIYSLWPTISLNRSSARLREILNYSPGFTFYQPSTVFNAIREDTSVRLVRWGRYGFAFVSNYGAQVSIVRSSIVPVQP